MKLGILANTNRHLDHIIGIARAANDGGHEVSIFAMDEATEIIANSDFRELCKCDNVIISICRHSAERRGVDTSTLSKEIVCGSQFNNAVMFHEADKVIVL